MASNIDQIVIFPLSLPSPMIAPQSIKFPMADFSLEEMTTAHDLSPVFMPDFLYAFTRLFRSLLSSTATKSFAIFFQSA